MQIKKGEDRNRRKNKVVRVWIKDKMLWEDESDVRDCDLGRRIVTDIDSEEIHVM